MSDMKDIEKIHREIQEAASKFREVVDNHGVRSFLFVMIPGTTKRFYDSNLWPGDPTFFYLNQAVNTDLTLKQEYDRWKHFVVGNRAMFNVECHNNIELESILELGKVYCVVSVLRAVDGYCFVLTDELGNLVKPPRDNSGFHSSRFRPDSALIQSN